MPPVSRSKATSKQHAAVGRPTSDAERSEDSNSGYETAREEEQYRAILKRIIVSDRKKRDLRRRQREAKFQADTAALEAKIESELSVEGIELEKRSKICADRFLAAIRKQLELEEKYHDEAKAFQKMYIQASGELLLAINGHLEHLQSVELVDTD